MTSNTQNHLSASITLALAPVRQFVCEETTKAIIGGNASAQSRNNIVAVIGGNGASAPAFGKAHAA